MTFDIDIELAWNAGEWVAIAEGSKEWMAKHRPSSNSSAINEPGMGNTPWEAVHDVLWEAGYLCKGGGCDRCSSLYSEHRTFRKALA